MKKLNYILIVLVLGALVLGVVNFAGKGKVEIVTEKTVIDSAPLDALKTQFKGYEGRLTGMEGKMGILEKGLSAIISSIQVILGQTQSFSQNLSQNLGGLVHNVQEIFSQGLKAGVDEREVINTAGQVMGPIGGFEWATTSRSTATTTLDNICRYGQWTITAGADGSEYTLRFPSTTTIALAQPKNNCLLKVGDTHTIMVTNVSSTIAVISTTTFSVYPLLGLEMAMYATSSDPLDQQGSGKAFINTGEFGILKFWKRSFATTTIIFDKARVIPR